MPHEPTQKTAIDPMKNPLPGTVQTQKGVPSRMGALGRTPSNAFQKALEQRREFLKKILASHEIRNPDELPPSAEELAQEPKDEEQEKAREEEKDEELVTRILSGEVSEVSPSGITIVYDRIASIGLALKESFPMSAEVKLAGYGAAGDIQMGDLVTLTYDESLDKDIRKLTAVSLNKRASAKAPVPPAPAAPAQ
jgi:hypothetical protein